jgi:hypothetical protein
MTIYTLIRSLFGLDSGRHCRHCGESVERGDAFGLSEGVCDACRA